MLNLSQIRNLRLAAAEVLTSPPNRESPGQRDEAADRSLNHTQARILSIGDDSILLYSRRLILQTAGYSVESARGDIATVEKALLRRFDLILLCHSITEELVHRIVEASTRIAPQTPLLQISPLDNPFRKQAHPALVSAAPVALLCAIARQLEDQAGRYDHHLRATG
jgi:CheY-like chemotaxis protein